MSGLDLCFLQVSREEEKLGARSQTISIRRANGQRAKSLQSFDQSFGLWTHRLGGINDPLKTQAGPSIEDPEDPLTVRQANRFDAGVGLNL